MLTGCNPPKDSEEVGVISREAGDKTKGFRFQKLRAAIRFLNRVEVTPNGQVHCAIEFLEDSIVLDGSADALISAEENKYYTSGLSFNSVAIKNTVVAFLDLHFSFGGSSDLKLGVYASAQIAKEKITAEVRESIGLEAKQKQYSILSTLSLGLPLEDEALTVALHIAKLEYSRQYAGNSKGFSALVTMMSREDFADFLGSIDWSISDATNESLEQEALKCIRGSRFFDYRHEGLESFLLAKLIDELEKRSGAKSSTDRLLSTDTLRSIFQAILLSPTADAREVDPAGDDIHAFDAGDFRNLSDKIVSVCPDFNKRILAALARSASLARSVEPGGEREMKALLRRILDACEYVLLEMNLSENMSQQDICDAFDRLTVVAETHILTLRASYKYKPRDRQAIKGALLTLFDDCYLAFNEVSHESHE